MLKKNTKIVGCAAMVCMVSVLGTQNPVLAKHVSQDIGYGSLSRNEGSPDTTKVYVTPEVATLLKTNGLMDALASTTYNTSSPAGARALQLKSVGAHTIGNFVVIGGEDDTYDGNYFTLEVNTRVYNEIAEKIENHTSAR